MLGRSILILLSTLSMTSAFARHPSGAANAVQKSHYARAHSLPAGYTFESRDGWQTVNATDLDYKYKRSSDQGGQESTLESRSKKSKAGKKKHGKNKSNKKHSSGRVTIGEEQDEGLVGTVKTVIKDIWEGLKGIGSHEKVAITWYTGQDLKNPSCWANTYWAPTDESFACALTLDGWSHKPKCFEFLELCNGPKKCVFVRVIDTCAGCAKGSKHVDLTRAAFGQLADWDEGKLNVQMRGATQPDGWDEELWGPKAGQQK